MPKLSPINLLLLSALAVATSVADEREINNEAEIRTTVELKQVYETAACNAALELSYYQKGSGVNVESSLTNPDCGASSGSYTLEVRYRDEAGEMQVSRFDEEWQRSNRDPVLLAKDYFVAENVEVIRVRSRKLRCWCETDEATDERQPPAEE